MRAVVVTLAVLLALVQLEMWFGKSGVPRVADLRGDLREQRAANDAARARNQQVQAELRDLKEGLEMVEEKARGELGMLRPDEILVKVVTPATASAQAQQQQQPSPPPPAPAAR
jgi:cell division protein FtsB